MKALIGHTGFIGSKIKSFGWANEYYSRSNISTIRGKAFDSIYCAAPTGNRLAVNQEPAKDSKNVDDLTSLLDTVKCKKFVMISTVDTLHAPGSVYGGNRLRLENFVKVKFQDFHIIRLCSLIDSDIKKNILYDIKHSQYLDSLNSLTVMHWYPLKRLRDDMLYIMQNNVKECNLVSEPISNQELFDFFHFKKKDLVTPYNLKCGLIDESGVEIDYICTKEQVKKYAHEYINDYHSK